MYYSTNYSVNSPFLKKILKLINIMTAVGSNPVSDFGFFMCEEVIQIAYGTSVVSIKSPPVPEITPSVTTGLIPPA